MLETILTGLAAVAVAVALVGFGRLAREHYRLHKTFRNLTGHPDEWTDEEWCAWDRLHRRR